MVTDAELRAQVQAMLQEAIPLAIDSLSKTAISPKTSPTERLKSIELLLRVANSDSSFGSNARSVLSEAVPFLEKIIKSHPSRRVLLGAIKEALRIAKLK